MINRRYQRFVFAFYMSLIMSGTMSLVISFINLGLIDGFLLSWGRVWSASFLVSYPIVLTITPMVHRLVKLSIRE